MQIPFIKHRLLLSLLIILILMSATSFKNADGIILVNEPLAFKPNLYYVSAVTDERADKGALAQIITKSAGDKNNIQPSNLQGGVQKAVSEFIEHNLRKDISLRPVTIGIKEFSVVEKALPNGSIDGRIKLQLSFGFEKDYGTEHLVDYQGGLHYIRIGNNTNVIEPRIRNVLKAGLVYFNDWMNNNAALNRKLAKAVKFNFTNYTEQSEGDTVYYSPDRPITWADFKSRTKPIMNASAEVMPGFGYALNAEVVNAVIEVNVNLKVYLPKSASWADSYGRDDYALNHEQRHFDITQIIAEQFKIKILDANLTPDTYEAFILMQYLDSYRDMYAMQRSYDKETNHSRNQLLQQEWNSRIDKELNAFKTIN